MCKQCNNDELRRSRKKGVQIHTNTKVCSICKEDRPLSEFTKRKQKAHLNQYANLYYSECSECKNSRSRERFNTFEGRAVDLCGGGRHRSKKLGLDFDLDKEWLVTILEKGVCEVTGIPFQMEGGKVNGGNRSFTPSLDRTDPTKGYTKDNTKVVVWIYNGAKGVGTHKDVMKLVEALANV